MEQPAGKKEKLTLAAGLLLALAVAAWQYYSPASRELARGSDVSVALLSERASVLLVYHPFSSTVNAFTSAHARPRKGASLWQRASDLALSAGGVPAGGSVFFVELSTAPDLEALSGALNGWRADPRLLTAAAAWVYRQKASGATNLSGFDLFSLFAEFSKLSSSNFILTEVSRRGQAAGAEEEEAAPARLVEVFNASGRQGLAARAGKRLRALGFNVITETSYPTLEKQTRIVGFSKDTSAALELRAALGLEELEIRVKPSQKSVAGAAVILGQDFDAAKLDK